MHRMELNRNRKLQIYTAPTKAKSREPAYSQALVRNKIDRQRVRFRESGRVTGNEFLEGQVTSENLTTTSFD